MTNAKMYIRNEETFRVSLIAIQVRNSIYRNSNPARGALALRVLDFIPEKYLSRSWENDSGNICIEYIESQVGRTVIEVMNGNQLIVHDQWHHKGASQKRTVIEWE